VSNLYAIQVQKTRLKALDSRLKGLQEKYEKLSSQVEFTSNAADKDDREKQLAAIAEEMTEIAKQCDSLKAQLVQTDSLHELPDALQSLVNLLTSLDWEIIAKTYRSCLSQGRHRLIPDTLEALVRQLADFPGELDEPQPLLRFVSLLIQEPSLAAEQQESLKAWAKTQGMPIQEESAGQLETAEICLMVKVRPRSLNDPSLGYLVSAAIAQDPNPWKSDVETITTPITIAVTPDPKCAPGFSQDDLPRILNELIATCGRDHHIPLTDLIIQWFLPIELMSLPVEHWQFQSGRWQKEYSGKRCKAVIVRSSDRHFSSNYQSVKSDWEKFWMRLLACLESRCTETLVHLDPIAGETTIDWGKTTVVGCKFVEHHDPDQQEDLWDKLLSQGVPIALWTRQSETKRRMQSLSTCTISKLSESLANHRQKALSHDAEIDRLKAASLCLLLDNPFRPFPTLDYQSA